jgi:hypothetical protein
MISDSAAYTPAHDALMNRAAGGRAAVPRPSIFATPGARLSAPSLCSLTLAGARRMISAGQRPRAFAQRIPAVSIPLSERIAWP